MKVTGVDHVNTIADDLEATASFYTSLLDFEVRQSPGSAIGFDGRWLVDASGRPTIHLMAFNERRHADLDRGSASGAIDHVALACEDFAGTIRRCEELGLAHGVNDRSFGGLRQVFVTDPNNVTLELNFAGD